MPNEPTDPSEIHPSCEAFDCVAFDDIRSVIARLKASADDLNRLEEILTAFVEQWSIVECVVVRMKDDDHDDGTVVPRRIDVSVFFENRNVEFRGEDVYFAPDVSHETQAQYADDGACSAAIEACVALEDRVRSECSLAIGRGELMLARGGSIRTLYPEDGWASMGGWA